MKKQDDFESDDELDASYDAYKALIEAGLSKPEALKRAGLTPQLLKDLEEGEDEDNDDNNDDDLDDDFKDEWESGDAEDVEDFSEDNWEEEDFADDSWDDDEDLGEDIEDGGTGWDD